MKTINPIFIDWVSGYFPIKNNPEIINELVGMFNHSTGELEDKKWIKKTVVEHGSYSSNVIIKSEDQNWIYFSGNPTKFLQGHNIVGTSNILDLMLGIYKVLEKVEGIYIDDFDYAKLKKGDFKLTRLDITGMYDINGSNLAVNEFIRAIQYQARTRSGKAVYSGNTVYFGKTSRRWSIKMYNKMIEMQKHTPAIEIPKSIMDWVKGKLRIELTIRGMELKDHGLEKGFVWLNNPNLINEIYSQYLAKIELGENNMKHIDEETLSKLKPRLVTVYQAWLAGNDLALQFPRMTFYRYRKEIKESLGVDITEPRADIKREETDNVIPLVRILEAKPAEIPYDIFKGYVVGY